MKQRQMGRLPLEAIPVGEATKESGRGSSKKTLEGVRLGRSGVNYEGVG